MIYFCVDVEASGPVPPLYNLLSIGATVVRPAGNHHVIGESLYIELKPIFPGFEREALEVCGLPVAPTASGTPAAGFGFTAVGPSASP